MLYFIFGNILTSGVYLMHFLKPNDFANVGPRLFCDTAATAISI